MIACAVVYLPCSKGFGRFRSYCIQPAGCMPFCSHCMLHARHCFHGPQCHYLIAKWNGGVISCLLANILYGETQGCMHLWYLSFDLFRSCLLHFNHNHFFQILNICVGYWVCKQGYLQGNVCLCINISLMKIFVNKKTNVCLCINISLIKIFVNKKTNVMLLVSHPPSSTWMIESLSESYIMLSC